jgi:EAL domain-containing protein (putative c-di-GMP-specific phosphodiesterase class I)
MGMLTIAEFVENEQVFERVRSLGVDYVQGHYLGQPQSNPETVHAESDDGFTASVA